jgi:hypothetical protein
VGRGLTDAALDQRPRSWGGVVRLTMNVNLTITHDGRNSARGRNGWFAPKYVTVRGTGELVTLGIMSKRPVWMPPIYLTLKRSEAKKVAEALLAVAITRRSKLVVGRLPRVRTNEAR